MLLLAVSGGIAWAFSLPPTYLLRAVALFGLTSALVLLTDGRANVALSGAQDRAAAMDDARAAAQRIRALGLDGVARLLLGALKVDFSVRLPLASGLADVLALRLDLVKPVGLGDAAIAPLLRGRV